MDSKEFKKIVNEVFKPLIISYGFKGSGFKYSKVVNEYYTYTMAIQLNKYGGSFCVELGVFVSILPNTINEKTEPSKATPYDCEFRKRMTPHWQEDFWWTFGKNREESITNIKNMSSIFEKEALSYFNQFLNFPEPIISISIEDLKSKNHKLDLLGAPIGVRAALILARTHKFLNNDTESLIYCKWGIENIEKATGLIPLFKELHNIEI